MKTTYQIKLSNRAILQIEEGPGSLTLISGLNEPSYIATITADGVLVFPNSCDGPDYLCRDLPGDSGSEVANISWVWYQEKIQDWTAYANGWIWWDEAGQLGEHIVYPSANQALAAQLAYVREVLEKQESTDRGHFSLPATVPLHVCIKDAEVLDQLALPEPIPDTRTGTALEWTAQYTLAAAAQLGQQLREAGLRDATDYDRALADDAQPRAQPINRVSFSPAPNYVTYCVYFERDQAADEDVAEANAADGKIAVSPEQNLGQSLAHQFALELHQAMEDAGMPGVFAVADVWRHTRYGYEAVPWEKTAAPPQPAAPPEEQVPLADLVPDAEQLKEIQRKRAQQREQRIRAEMEAARKRKELWEQEELPQRVRLHLQRIGDLLQRQDVIKQQELHYAITDDEELHTFPVIESLKAVLIQQGYRIAYEPFSDEYRPADDAPFVRNTGIRLLISW